jgi:membrane carboxypeptidase/penicillin-binding protein
MYCNLHFMGHGQYGFAAAASTTSARLSGVRRLSYDLPISHPERALMRHNYAIDRMVAEENHRRSGRRSKIHPISLSKSSGLMSLRRTL